MARSGCSEIAAKEQNQMYFQISDTLNKTNKPYSAPKEFQDVKWHLAISKTSPTPSVQLELENYDHSKSYDVEGFYVFCQSGKEPRTQRFEKRFEFDDNTVKLQITKEGELLEDSDVEVLISMMIKVKTFKASLPSQKVLLMFPGDRLFVNRDLLRRNSQYFQNLDLSREVLLNERKIEFLDVIQILEGNKDCQIHKKNIGYLMRMAKEYQMNGLMEKCEMELKTSSQISKEEAICLADKYKLCSVLNPAMGKFRNIQEIREFENSENFRNLETKTKEAVWQRKNYVLAGQRNGADPNREAQQNLVQLQDQFAGFQFQNQYQHPNRRTTAEQILLRVNEMRNQNLQEKLAFFRAKFPGAPVFPRPQNYQGHQGAHDFQ